MNGMLWMTERAQSAAIPLAAMFELTGRCNLDCGHCYLDIAHPPDELTTAQAFHVIDELKRAGTLFLALTGGELLLRRDALEIAAHARKQGMALRLFTNATRVTRAIAAEIAKLRPLAVEVSLYGSHAAAHDGVTRRQRTLRRTLRGAVLLRQAGVRLKLKAPLLSTVTGELDRLHEIADRLGSEIVFDAMVTPRLDGAEAPLSLRADAEALARALAHPRLASLRGESLPGPPDPDDLPCALARHTTRISPTGDVYPCPSYPVPVGNLLQRSFTDIWSGGELLDRLRALRVKDLEGDCHGCAKGSYCGRCTAVALIEHGRELGPSREACRVADAKERVHGAGGGTPDRVRLRVVA
jgi:radical SAM protein with 4Fe4S-binding SPASM domain